MRIGSIRGCVIRVHPLFPCMLLFLCIGGALWPTVAFLSALILHESAHFLYAVCMRIPVTQIELTPFGGSMQIPLVEALPPRQVFILSAAGPVSNLILLCLSLLVSWRFSIFHPFLLSFIQGNAAMLCINLLPVLPLDGGRMLLSVLSRYFNRARLLRIFLLCGRLTALVLILLSFIFALHGTPRFSYAILGVYLLYAAALEEKTGVSRYLAAFMARRIRFEKRKTLPVQTLCASSALPVFMLIGQLRPGAYHIIHVIHEPSLRLMGQLSEADLLSYILDHSSLTLGEIISL